MPEPIAVTFLTRRCPRNCEYCLIRDAKDVGPELTVEQWAEAFGILEQMGVAFNLILGNEPWILGKSLVEIVKHIRTPYGLYTTCPEPIFSRYRNDVFAVVDNLSCGVDWPLSYLKKKKLPLDDTELKSLNAWNGMKWVKLNAPHVECHASVTIHRGNFRLLHIIAQELSELGVFFAVNFLHWDSDGGFDFFPKKEELRHLIIPPEDNLDVRRALDLIIANPGLVQNLEMLKAPLHQATNIFYHWHCNGNPYGGPTIDSDGKLRVCGYRKGKYTPQFSIFELPENLEQWKTAVYLDAMECPGCFWPCPWMWHNTSENIGIDIFTRHAGDHIPKELWSNRRVNK